MAQPGQVPPGAPAEGPQEGRRLMIREMILENFKSYAGEQRVGPFHKARLQMHCCCCQAPALCSARAFDGEAWRTCLLQLFVGRVE